MSGSIDDAWNVSDVTPAQADAINANVQLPSWFQRNFGGDYGTSPNVDTTSTWDQTGGGAGGGGAGGGDLAKALQGLGKMGAGSAAQQLAMQKMGTIPQATIGKPGAPVNLASLLQLLMQKQNQYFPGSTNTQPVTMNRPQGLLGM